jgi:hypothetical protein
MPSWLYESGPNGLWVFFLLTMVIGGSAAWISGKTIAQTWRPFWQVPVYMILLTGAVRFLHYALFAEPLLPLRNWVVDLAVLMAAATLGYKRMRALQISTQYFWLFEPKGLLGWRRKGHERKSESG